MVCYIAALGSNYLNLILFLRPPKKIRRKRRRRTRKSPKIQTVIEFRFKQQTRVYDLYFSLPDSGRYCDTIILYVVPILFFCQCTGA